MSEKLDELFECIDDTIGNVVIEQGEPVDQALDEVYRLARLGAAVEAMPPGTHLKAWDPQPDNDNWCVSYYKHEDDKGMHWTARSSKELPALLAEVERLRGESQ